MKSAVSASLALIIATAALTSPARAQHAAPSQWAVDGAIGIAFPLGDFGNAFGTGFDLMGAAEYHPQQTGPFYFRGELGYSHFGANAGIDADASIVRFAVDGMYDFPVSHSSVQPYALAGLGIYHVSAGVNNCPVGADCSSGNTGLGINLGAGLRYALSTIQLFGEIRYQVALISGDAPFIPIQFGVRYVVK
jgi:hypothetical protein